MRPAPQGRGYRVRKRSNHVTVIVDMKGTAVLPQQVQEEPKKEEVVTEFTEVKVEEKKAKKDSAKKTTKKKTK